MGKISLYDFLSVVLPGALLTLAIKMTIPASYLYFNQTKLNNYFLLTTFPSSSIFLGSCINILTRKALKTYRKMGIPIHTDLEKIYNTSKSLVPIKPFFEEKMTALALKGSDKSHFDFLWSTIYFELEATNSITPSKDFQSFYFFFRNFFTLGFFLFLVIGVSIFINGFSDQYIPLLIANSIMIVLSIPAGEWNRKKMVERIFWTYYSLHNNK